MTPEREQELHRRLEDIDGRDELAFVMTQMNKKVHQFNLRQRREARKEIRDAQAKFKVGDRVHWTSTRYKKVVTGVVERIKGRAAHIMARDPEVDPKNMSISALMNWKVDVRVLKSGWPTQKHSH